MQTREITEHDIILAQRAQLQILAEPLRTVAALSDDAIDAISPEDARHTLKVYSAIARAAVERARPPE